MICTHVGKLSMSAEGFFGDHFYCTAAAPDATDGRRTEARGQQKQSNDPSNNQHILNTPIIGCRCRANGTPCHIQHSPNTPTTGLRERGNDTSKSTGRSGRQKATTGRNLRREERVTVQGPVKTQKPDGMSHRGVKTSSCCVWIWTWVLSNFFLVHRPPNPWWGYRLQTPGILSWPPLWALAGEDFVVFAQDRLFSGT